MRTIDFSPLFRHSVGFDRMQRLLDAAAQTEQTAPTRLITSNNSAKTAIR